MNRTAGRSPTSQRRISTRSSTSTSRASFFLTQKLVPLLADGGSIVNLSTGLTRVTGPDRAVYASVKGAVEVLTRYLAEELGPRGITVNTIAPGAVATDFSDGVPARQRNSCRS